jgi:hypothetical protein
MDIEIGRGCGQLNLVNSFSRFALCFLSLSCPILGSICTLVYAKENDQII